MSSNPPFHATGFRYDASHQAMSAGQLGCVVAGIVLIHIVIGWGLLQIKAVRDAVVEAAPMFFEVVAEPTPSPPSPPPQSIPKITPSAPLISAPTPTVSHFVTESPPAEVPEAHEPAAVQATTTPPAPSPAPKIIPVSAIKYLVPPQMVYPRASKPFHESGRVLTRVYVDEAGLPREVQINKSSGFPRLDEAAIQAVQKARFKPYTENGEPTAGWALIPLNFELE